MRQDFHLHSTFSFDGKSTVEEHLMWADAFSLDEICITDHFNPLSPVRPTLKEGLDPRLPDLPALRREITRVNSLGYATRVLMGVELGLYNDLSCEICEELLREVPLDFIILGAHFNRGGREYYNAGEWGDHTKKRAQTEYLEHNLLPFLRQMDNYDVVAHITFFSRACPHTDKEIRYEEAPDLFDAALTHLIQRGKGIEINTSTLLPFGFSMPGESVLRRYKELGGSIVTLGSDAHHKDHLYDGIDWAKDLLLSCGFSHYTTYQERKPRFHPL